MALRTAQVKLGTLVRAGVLSLAQGGPTCVAHTLPATPDSITWAPVVTPNACPTGTYLQSWDGISVIFVNSVAAQNNIYVRIAVEHTIIQ